MLDVIPLEKIKPEDYQSGEELEDCLEAAKDLVKVEMGEKPKPVVFQQDGVYRILEGREIVSAYAVFGEKDIPVEILPPGHVDIPTYIRNNKW